MARPGEYDDELRALFLAARRVALIEERLSGSSASLHNLEAMHNMCDETLENMCDGEKDQQQRDALVWFVGRAVKDNVAVWCLLACILVVVPTLAIMVLVLLSEVNACSIKQ